jgi:predicted ATPase/DNA-binding SARP family transcriptional activator/tetratricopeptide (TPR) repeat protein
VAVELILLSRVVFRDREITGPRLRGLLALLARDLRSGCSTARLMDGLWPDEQPENPAKALQVLVSRARARLGSDVIVHTPTGYRLALREDQVDASAVLLSASASTRHSGAGDPAAALADAEAGLALWDGATGGDAGLDDPLSVLRAERASTYRSLVRARALALARLGRHGEAVEALTTVARERPRDEEVLLELLRAEAATVGPSAALARYEAYRRWLRDELGTDPGGALQAMHQQLLQGAAPAVRHGVQHEPNPLLGRDDDLAAVASLLRTSRVASIVGPGGLGKTRLAHAVSRRAEQRVVHFVALAGVAGDADVVGEVASVLGVGESRPTAVGPLAIPPDVLTGIVDTLGPGPALLVLDNCEHLIRGVADLVGALVSMTRDLRVLTTSRAPLDLSSESVYLLPELDLPTTVELFGQRARAARPGVELPDDVVTELCRHLDGLPLAVELAAARVRVMSVGEIARRLEDRFSLLRGGPRDAPERHHTLQAVVDWSWNLLDPAGQAAMRALSVFPGGFTADAARQLLDDDALRVVEHLVDQSLLKVVDTPSGARFRMLETVREFSTAEREAAGETDRVVDRFLSWARHFGVANHESPFGADPASTLDLIRAEQDNLLQALRYGLAGVDGATVAATAAVLAALWTVDSNYTRMAALGRETAWVLSHHRPAPEFVDVTRTVAALSTAYEFTTQGPHAVRSLVVLRRLPPAPPDTPIRAIAAILRAAPELDPAGLTELSNSDEPLLAGVVAAVASYLWENAGDTDGALKAAERMLEVLEHRESAFLRIVAHSRLAELHMHVDDGAEALRHLRAAWLDRDKLGNWPDVIGIRWAMVVASLQVGALDEAEHWLELAGVDLADDMFAYRTFELAVRGELLLARGEIDTGLVQWRRAVELLVSGRLPGMRVEPGLEPWSLEIKAVAVVAHARHGRLDLVAETVRELPPALAALLTDPVQGPLSFVTGLPLCGALLLALAMVDFDRGERTGDERATRSAARLVALAERFGYLRQFQPTMSVAGARHAAERADRSAYSDAVSSYADLGRDELRGAALVALRERG